MNVMVTERVVTGLSCVAMSHVEVTVSLSQVAVNKSVSRVMVNRVSTGSDYRYFVPNSIFSENSF